MTSSSRRRRGGLVAIIAVLGLVFAVAPSAQAETTFIPGDPPPEVTDQFETCPGYGDVTYQALYCLKITAYDGEIKLGDTVAQIEDPIEMIVAVTHGSDGEGGTVTEIVSAEGGDGPSAVPLSGGLLGVPELDPLIEADPIGVLGVSATPQVGTPGVASGELAFLQWLTGTSVDDVTINLPLSIKVNNLLLGDDCEIPEFDVNLTTGTTAPPAGVEPMTGEHGEFTETYYEVNHPSPLSPEAHRQRIGARLVDNTFAVPEAADCGVAGTGKALNAAGLGELNVFDQLVSGQAGLPSPAGNNYASFSVDTEVVGYSMLARIEATPRRGIDFGFVDPGFVSEPKTVTFENRGATHPMFLDPLEISGDTDAYEILNNGCSEVEVLAPGEKCSVEARAVLPDDAPTFTRYSLDLHLPATNANRVDGNSGFTALVF